MNLDEARRVAGDLERLFNAETDKMHADAKLWPFETATALQMARNYTHRVFRFLAATDDPDGPCVAEARTAFEHVERYGASLGAVFESNADLALAVDALKDLLRDAA